MEVMIGIVVILLGIAIFYIVHLKISITKATKDIQEKIGLDTNALLTTSNNDRQLRQLLHVVNQLLIASRQVEIEVETKNRQLQKTIINISHDLKTPLTSALGYMELLEKYELSQAKQEKYKAIVIDKLQRLSSLIEDFFAFTKNMANEQNIEWEVVDMNRIFEEVIVCYYQDFTTFNRSIEIIGSHKMEILSNEKMLRRIFENIIINALKHSHSDVYITIDDTNDICFTFRNEIEEPLDTSLLFEEFYTADISRTKQNTGLGLAIVKEFTTLLGGNIQAYVEDDTLVMILCFKRNI